MHLSDIEIAQRTKLLPVSEVARRAGIEERYLEPYGKYKAKIDLSFLSDRGEDKKGKLVLVTAITPTPAGEGKTTTTIGLADGLKRIGKKVAVAIREPSLGPVFGIKGGATGGGYAQVAPMEDINLHFTGDFHAISAANNLLCAMVDNHIHQGNELNIEPLSITVRRAVDMNDRQLRNIVDGLGGKSNGTPREDGFDITVASEVMAIFCLSENLADLKRRLARMVIGYDRGGSPVTCGMLKAHGAMCALLKDALKPNLVQTLEGTPAVVHGGPFANIAHGCNSVIATRTAMLLGDYAVTEAGFGADLGAEKFLDIKCRTTGLVPSCAVVVATVRALKMHGGVPKEKLAEPDTAALREGLPNLMRHVHNIKDVYGLPCAVAVNKFPTDTREELNAVVAACEKAGVKAVVSSVWEDGGKGGEALAREVVRLSDGGGSKFTFAYRTEDGIEKKINDVAIKIYGGKGAEFTPAAKKQAEKLAALGFGNLPVCIAKTQYSFSDNPKLICAPENFTITVKSLKVSAGAGFIVALTGDIMTMPGLPKAPAAEKIDVDENGLITGLF